LTLARAARTIRATPRPAEALPEETPMHRWLPIAALFAALSLINASAALAQAPEKPKLTVGVGGKPLFYYLPLTIAEQKGYFKDEGLDVEIQDFPGGARALQALLGGSVDVVSGAYEHTISQQAKGQNIEAVFLQGKYSSIVLLMAKAKAAQYKSPADLKGLKIGVTAPGSSTNMFVNILLAKAGLKPDSVAIIGAGATAGAVAIMKRGEIDALANLDPVISQLESGGDMVAVVDTRTAKGMDEVYGGAYAAGCVYVPVEFARKYPNTTQAFVNAMMRALRFIQTSTPEQIVAAVPPEYYADRALYKAALEKNLEAFRHDGQISVAAGNNVLRDLKSFDPTVQAATIDIAKTIDMSFAQKAGQKYR
jgi:NitT/TauT family transport system substrate-binding protein